jgi:hydrogenase maturation protein HypF
VLDFSPLLPALLGCKDNAAYGAALFHATVAAGLAAWVNAIPQGDFLRGALTPKKEAKIAIGGGCAMNAVLMSALRSNLNISGFDLLEASQVPPNDGGLALGQAWVGRRGGQLVSKLPLQR